MPNEKMTALYLSGPVERLDDAIRRFVIDRDFHPEEAVSFLADIRRTRPVSAEDPCGAVLPRLTELLERLGLKPEKVPFGDFDPAQTEELTGRLNSELTALEEEAHAIAQELEREESDPILHSIRNVPESILDLWELRYVHIRVGRLPADQWPELEAVTAERNDEIAVKTLEEPDYVHVIALALPESLDRLDGTLAGLGFERFRPESSEFPDCTPAEELRRFEEKKKAASQRLEEIGLRRRQMREEYGPELLARRAWLKHESVCAQARAYAGQRAGRFYLGGWVPEKQAESFAAEYEAEPGFSCVSAKPSQVKAAKPPVRMEDKGIGSVLTPLMRMYGMPAYGTLDPRVFMVITYTVFFGMMFGDAGQGACLALFGFLMYRKNRQWLWRTIGICGCSAVVFGLIYGSVFGLEELLPWGGYHPLEAEHIMPVLLAGAALGIVVILVCMVFNIINGFRAGDLRTALFSANGVCGAVFYTAVLGAVVGAYTKLFNLFTGWFIVLFIVLPILLIWFGEPLAKRLQHRPDWKPESWGMFVVEGFFDIFEAAISYMSNTMSFLRVGAFAISHAGMMMVVSMLSEGASAAGSVVVMILGNIFVALLEAALSSIQIIRLQFYEIFGRFYVGGGTEFAPITVDYTK